MTSYMLMYILSPYLNKFLDSINQKEHRSLLLGLILIFVLLTSVFGDVLETNGGYSLAWFIILYFTAAYIKKYSISIARFKNLIYLVCSLLTFVLLIIGNKSSAYLSSIANQYNFVFTFIGSVCLFLFFKDINIESEGMIGKTISKTSSLTLGVYLFHEHDYLRPIIWQKLVKLQNFVSDKYAFAFVMIISALLIYLSGIVIYQLWLIVYSLAEKKIRIFKKKDRVLSFK